MASIAQKSGEDPRQNLIAVCNNAQIFRGRLVDMRFVKELFDRVPKDGCPICGVGLRISLTEEEIGIQDGVEQAVDVCQLSGAASRFPRQASYQKVDSPADLFSGFPALFRHSYAFRGTPGVGGGFRGDLQCDLVQHNIVVLSVASVELPQHPRHQFDGCGVLGPFQKFRKLAQALAFCSEPGCVVVKHHCDFTLSSGKVAGIGATVGACARRRKSAYNNISLKPFQAIIDMDPL
ncbi:MAG TPA: hypothetical protein VMB85_16725 [Bryobacteraceae bacterium]|nr:hypothetical protein [Bryobacteraceae bacterium]